MVRLPPFSVLLPPRCIHYGRSFFSHLNFLHQADEKAGDINYKFLRESLNSLTKGFTTVAKDRSGSKRLALFAVTNTLFKIYFKVNTLQLCGKLINVVEGPGSNILQDLRAFPVSDVVMYKYYIGRLKMFEDRYTEAR